MSNYRASFFTTDEHYEMGWLPSLLVKSGIHQQSLVFRLIGRFGINDRVENLRHMPLGMFFYNTRAIFFLCSALYILILNVFSALSNTGDWLRIAVLLLGSTWLVDVLITLLLHYTHFCPSIDEWGKSNSSNDLPSVFLRYFMIDYFVVCIMLIIGKRFGLDISHFIFLLIANLLVFGTYGGQGRGQILLLLSLPVVIFFYFITALLHECLEKKRTSFCRRPFLQRG